MRIYSTLIVFTFGIISCGTPTAAPQEQTSDSDYYKQDDSVLKTRNRVWVSRNSVMGSLKSTKDSDEINFSGKGEFIITKPLCIIHAGNAIIDIPPGGDGFVDEGNDTTFVIVNLDTIKIKVSCAGQSTDLSKGQLVTLQQQRLTKRDIELPQILIPGKFWQDGSSLKGLP